MTPHGPRPPALASWLLRRLLPGDGRADSIAGDLLEEFRLDLARHARRTATRRYWGRVLSVSIRLAFAERRDRSVEATMHRAPGAAAWLDSLRQDLRYAVRSLLRSPGFTAVAVLTLAVGVGANTAIFSVLHAVVLRDLPYRDADRLALLWSIDIRRQLRDGSSYLNILDWSRQSRTFDGMAVYRRPEFTIGTLTGGHEPERVQLALVGPRFFHVLGALPLRGAAFDPGDPASARSAVISHRLWRQRFAGREDAVGGSLTIDGAAFTITGVMPPDFAFPGAGVDAWLPISVVMDLTRAAANPGSRDGDPLFVIARLAPGATVDAGRAELETIAARLREIHPVENADKGVEIEPLTDHLLGRHTARSLWLLLGAVGFVLLIACANVAGLALARGAGRRAEFSIRTALGASRARLVRQSLTENIVLGAWSAGVGLLIAWLATAALRAWASHALPRMEQLRIEPVVLLFAGAVTLCGIAASLLPALHLSALDPARALGEDGPRTLGGRGTRRFRQTLVVAEIAVAVVLLAGAGLLIRSFVRLQGVERGFDAAHVLSLRVDLGRRYDGQTAKAEYFRAAFERIRALPGVVAAGAIDDLFIRRHGDLRIVAEGAPPSPPGEAAPRLIRDRVVPGYFEAAHIPLVQGRFLLDSDLVADLDRDHPQAVVINEAMARRFWPGGDPLGKRITYGENPGPNAQWSRVVGVVADMRRETLDRPAFPTIFWPGFGPQMDVVVRTTGNPGAMRDAIRAALLAVDPAVPPYGVAVAEQHLGQTVAVRTLQTLLLAALAAAALTLAVIGVYGLVHQSVVVRTREIGVRMALGATRMSVGRMVLTSALRLAAIGLAIGLAGAVAIGRTIGAFLYETSPLDALTFLAVPVLLIVVTVAGTLVPARRAARVDPIAALRVE